MTYVKNGQVIVLNATVDVMAGPHEVPLGPLGGHSEHPEMLRRQNTDVEFADRTRK